MLLGRQWGGADFLRGSSSFGLEDPGAYGRRQPLLAQRPSVLQKSLAAPKDALEVRPETLGFSGALEDLCLDRSILRNSGTERSDGILVRNRHPASPDVVVKSARKSGTGAGLGGPSIAPLQNPEAADGSRPEEIHVAALYPCGAWRRAVSRFAREIQAAAPVPDVRRYLVAFIYPRHTARLVSLPRGSRDRKGMWGARGSQSGAGTGPQETLRYHGKRATRGTLCGSGRWRRGWGSVGASQLWQGRALADDPGSSTRAGQHEGPRADRWGTLLR
jgi:hypothetical protein